MVPAAKTSIEKLMICVETGLITGCAALVELIFFLAFRNSFLHFILFYMLPKLYSNALMATLNARLAIPGRKFRETGRWEWVQPEPIKEKVPFPMFAEMIHLPEDEKQETLSQRPSVSSSASECASTIEAFWSTYTPINKYSPAFMVSRTASRRNRVSVGSVTVFDSEDPHLAKGWMIYARPEDLHVRES
ncbi:hypothetical protein L218DRAFT_484632 [Marasmius fiardii PR-910]|nr:hypothetical protein L218DRAFT_484632 [Marasmius fiardii PR-910]